MLKKILDLCLSILVIFLVFTLITSTIPYLRHKEVSAETAEAVKDMDYYGDKTGPDRIRLVETPVDAMNVRLSLVMEAKESLDIVYYKIQSGDCADAFFGEVLNAADRGVRIRILIDGKVDFLGMGIRKDLKAVSTHKNIELRQYNPVQLTAPTTIQALMHDKFIIADGQLLLIGGRNIDDRHFEPEGYLRYTTHDRDILVWKAMFDDDGSASAVNQVQEYLQSLWDYERTYEIGAKHDSGTEKRLDNLRAAADDFKKTNGGYYAMSVADYKSETIPTNKITLLTNPIEAKSKEPVLAYSLQQLALQSSNSVIVQTPYATANKNLLSTMEAVCEGAEMTMVTNSIISTPNFPAFSNYYFQRTKFVDTGVQIYEYNSVNSIHGKSMIIDDRLSVVGSFNLDDRSMYISTESMLVIDSPEFSEILTSAIDDIKDISYQVGEDNRYIDNGTFQTPKLKSFQLFMVYILLRPFQKLL